MLKRSGFIFIETIIVVCVLTVGLLSLYANYSKIIANTKELNTFDTAEYNYKTSFLKNMYLAGNKLEIGIDEYGNSLYLNTSSSTNQCYTIDSNFSDDSSVKICLLKNIISTYSTVDTVEKYLSSGTSGNEQYKKFDAYIIDYLLNQDLMKDNDSLFLVEYKRKDKQNSGEYLTYISSLNF